MPTGVQHPRMAMRLKRIEGQVRGIVRMVEAQRYCIDIVQQITAARRALDEAALGIMKDHINACVSQAIRKREGAAKIDELMQTLHRFVK